MQTNKTVCITSDTKSGDAITSRGVLSGSKIRVITLQILADLTDSRLRHPIPTMEANVAAELHRLIGAAFVVLLQSRTVLIQPCQSSYAPLVFSHASPERALDA